MTDINLVQTRANWLTQAQQEVAHEASLMARWRTVRGGQIVALIISLFFVGTLAALCIQISIWFNYIVQYASGIKLRGETELQQTTILLQQQLLPFVAVYAICTIAYLFYGLIALHYAKRLIKDTQSKKVDLYFWQCGLFACLLPPLVLFSFFAAIRLIHRANLSLKKQGSENIIASKLLVRVLHEWLPQFEHANEASVSNEQPHVNVPIEPVLAPAPSMVQNKPSDNKTHLTDKLNSAPLGGVDALLSQATAASLSNIDDRPQTAFNTPVAHDAKPDSVDALLSQATAASLSNIDEQPRRTLDVHNAQPDSVDALLSQATAASLSNIDEQPRRTFNTFDVRNREPDSIDTLLSQATAASLSNIDDRPHTRFNTRDVHRAETDEFGDSWEKSKRGRKPGGVNKSKRLLVENITESFLDTLPKDEAQIVRMRFGIEPFKRPRTLEEVGNKFNVSFSRIYQIESKVLQRLKNPHSSSFMANEEKRNNDAFSHRDTDSLTATTNAEQQGSLVEHSPALSPVDSSSPSKLEPVNDTQTAEADVPEFDDLLKALGRASTHAVEPEAVLQGESSPLTSDLVHHEASNSMAVDKRANQYRRIADTDEQPTSSQARSEAYERTIDKLFASTPLASESASAEPDEKDPEYNVVDTIGVETEVK